MSNFENVTETGTAMGRILNMIHNPEIVDYKEAITFMAHCISVLDERGFETLKAMISGYIHIQGRDPISTITTLLQQHLITEAHLTEEQSAAQNESEV